MGAVAPCSIPRPHGERTVPGARAALGLLRVLEEGRFYYLEDWVEDDLMVSDGTSPRHASCTDHA